MPLGLLRALHGFRVRGWPCQQGLSAMSVSLQNARLCRRQNMKRAFKLSPLLQAIIFIVLFFSGKYLYAKSLEAVSGACASTLSQPHHDHHDHRHSADGDQASQLTARLQWEKPTLLPGSLDLPDTKDAAPLPGFAYTVDISGDFDHLHRVEAHHPDPPPMTPGDLQPVQSVRPIDMDIYELSSCCKCQCSEY